MSLPRPLEESLPSSCVSLCGMLERNDLGREQRCREVGVQQKGNENQEVHVELTSMHWAHQLGFLLNNEFLR